MRKKVISLLLCAVMMFSCMVGCSTKKSEIEITKYAYDLGNKLSSETGKEGNVNFNYNSVDEMLSAMKKACSNGKFSLYFSPENLAVALKNDKTGEIVTTNPFGVARDENYSGNIAERLDSQVVITYLKSQNTLAEFYSSVDCAALGQYTVNVHENGLSVEMSLGKDSGNEILPLVFSKKRYEQLIKKLDSDDKDRLDAYYSLYKKDELTDSGVYDLYPDFKAQDIYFVGADLSEREQSLLKEIFKNANYSKEEFNKDMSELGIDGSATAQPNFKFTLNYILTENGVDVCIPSSSISYQEEYPLIKLSLLPYFGAETPQENKNGYLFIPDGSGALIDINQTNDSRRTTISGKVYGETVSKIHNTNSIEEKTEQYYLPVFGTKGNNGAGLYGIIKSGDANADITAYLGKPNGNYYSVSPLFTFRDSERYTNENKVSTEWSKQTFYLYEENQNTDDIAVSYYFLANGKSEYSDMAEIYRNYLFGGEKENETTFAGINIETIGSALADSEFLGFDRKKETAFTTFDDDVKLLEELKKNGLEKISLNLSGWQNNGLDHTITNDYKPSAKLGGKSGLKKLNDYCKKNDTALTLETNISYVSQDKFFDSFSKKSDAARSLDKLYAKNVTLEPDTMKYNKGEYIVSPDVYSRFIKLIKDDAAGYSALLGLGKLGTDLNANYSKDNHINRSAAKHYLTQALSNLERKATFTGANAYVLRYAESLNELPTGNSSFAGETSAVPFLQLVVSGYAICNSEKINLESDTDAALLDCIWSGTVPSFLVAYQNSTALKKTAYTQYYSVDYEILKNDLKKAYEFLSPYLKNTDEAYMTGHKLLNNGVSVSYYSNGSAVYVNKTETEFKTGNIVIPAKAYLAVGGGEN